MFSYVIKHIIMYRNTLFYILFVLCKKTKGENDLYVSEQRLCTYL
jgi:hypothetical protein